MTIEQARKNTAMVRRLRKALALANKRIALLEAEIYQWANGYNPNR